jgi:glyoxylase-like metal-dependent hydrolase (beta-lactamase superfamily II)
MKIIDLHFLGNTEAVAAFLLETTAGPILFETGPHSTFAQLEKGVQALGYELEQIKHVFLTHIHFDHAGAAWALAAQGATIYVHPLGERHLHQPEKLVQSAKMIYQDQMDALWGEMQPIAIDLLYAAQHDEVFQIGDTEVRALHTPGHAVHHIAWQVGEEIICGDIAGVKINGGIVVPPCPPPDINIEHWRNSIQLLRERSAKVLYLTHYGRITHVDSHLNELEKRLIEWSEWIKPHFLAQTPMQEVIPKFEAYVEGELWAAKISNEIALRYAAANPPFMSVAGLYRYWGKRG